MIDKDEKVYQAYSAPAKPRGVPGNAVIGKDGVIVYMTAGFDEKAILKAVDAALKK